MKFRLKHRDRSGNITFHNESLSHIAFTKHLAFAGAGIHRSPASFFRFLGYFFEFAPYWSIRNNRIELPEIFNNDPTEKMVVSNKIGRGIADYLAKKYYRARFTHCYEDVMKR